RPPPHGFPGPENTTRYRGKKRVAELGARNRTKLPQAFRRLLGTTTGPLASSSARPGGPKTQKTRESPAPYHRSNEIGAGPRDKTSSPRRPTSHRAPRCCRSTGASREGTTPCSGFGKCPHPGERNTGDPYQRARD